MNSQSLKQKTISGILWSFSDSFITQTLQFIVGLILARLLSPAEFGLVGMVTVFLALAQSFVDSGFSQALIRKNDADDIDFSTIFYFNLIIGCFFSAFFYFSAPLIASFYSQPELVPIARLLGVIILINALTITQRTILAKRVDFKLLTKINFTASLISGVVAIAMAYKGFGVWSLVWRSIISAIIQSVLLWSFNRWVPLWVFSKDSFKSLFSFGSKLLLSGLLDTIYKNIYLLIIGKFFSAQELGYYTRADQFNRLPSQNITGNVQRVSYPILSLVQDDDERLKAGYKKIVSSTMFISFFAMLGMAAAAKSIVLVLIGEKWLPSVEYLQILCFSGMLFPLHALNLNVLKVKGRSDLFFRLEIIKKILAIPVILAGVYFGIRSMLIGMTLLSFIAYYINSFYSGKFIKYPVLEQLTDILPSFILAFTISGATFVIGIIINTSNMLTLIVQGLVFISLTLVFSEVFKLKGYLDIKYILFDKLTFLKTFFNGKTK